jgi:F0F1-type ATP synthase membrane subunit c/vacuolar-type H+-ATPase subunit K
MKPINQSTQPNVDARYRVMLVIWFALLSAVGIYFVVAQVVQPPEVDSAQNKMLTPILFGLGTLVVVVSFAVKQRFLRQSVERQEVALVQTGFIVAVAMCEASALFGLVDLMVTGNRYYFVVMMIGALGILFHFPRRDHLLGATYKNRLDLGEPGK